MPLSPKLIAIAISLSVIGVAHGQQPTTDKANLLTNPSFEDGQKGWEFSSHGKHGACTVETIEKREGTNSIRITNSVGDDSFLKQAIVVKPKTRYRLSGYIKTMDVLVKGTGATLSLEGGFEHTESITGKKSWTKVSFEFDSGAAASIKVGCRLGHHSSPAMGVAWFDDLTLIELGPGRKR